MKDTQKRDQRRILKAFNKSLFSKAYIVVLILLLSFNKALALAGDGMLQNGNLTLKGSVIDASLGEHLIGVSISLKGTPTLGTITDVNGEFTLTIPAEKANHDLLVVSYIGFTTQELKIGTKTRFDIKLEESSRALDEVVVVGYGVQKKVNLSGAVDVAKGDVLENRPIGNVAEGLQGVIPNLNINFASGAPTAKTEFNIRGATSINGGGALVLVDGVETNDLGLLNPQDIESVSVLKDASSAAVYGARAAFGVILITTKTGGKDQKVKVNYNNNFSWSTASRLPKGVRSDIWLHSMNQANINNGGGQYFTDAQVEATEAYIRDPKNNPLVSLQLKVNGLMLQILTGLRRCIKPVLCINTMPALRVERVKLDIMVR